MGDIQCGVSRIYSRGSGMPAQCSAVQTKYRACARERRPNLGHIITSDGHSKKAMRATNKAMVAVDSTL